MQPFALPNEFWDYEIPEWTRREVHKLGANLTFISVKLPFCTQEVINRVHALVNDTLAKAKAGELSAKDAIDLLRFRNVFTPEEIRGRVSETYADIIANFYKNRTKDNYQ